jgi:4-aminobutyrate aminotransferase-like enzyme
MRTPAKIRYACPCDETGFYPPGILADRARGAHVWAVGDETPYLDLVLGYSSLNFGHCHPRLVLAAQEACARLTQVHSLNSHWKLDLSARLVGALPLPPAASNEYQVYFDVGGSAAVSAALRLCRNATGRTKVVAFTGAFHGISLDAAAASDERLLDRPQFGLPLPPIVRVPFPRGGTSEATDECLGALSSAIRMEDELPAAVIVEPVQGAGGFIIPPPDFLKRLSDFCRDIGLLLIIDEIQSGVGRCGSLFAYERFDGPVIPDVVLLSKSLAGGFFPLSAVIAKVELFSAVPAFRSAFQTTFNNSPLGTYVAGVTLDLADEDGLYSNAQLAGASLVDGLQFVSEYAFCTALRGLGLAIAFEIVDPIDGHARPDIAKDLMSAAFGHHVLLYISGVERNVIKIAPPITADAPLLAQITVALRHSLEDVRSRHGG